MTDDELQSLLHLAVLVAIFVGYVVYRIRARRAEDRRRFDAARKRDQVRQKARASL